MCPVRPRARKPRGRHPPELRFYRASLRSGEDLEGRRAAPDDEALARTSIMREHLPREGRAMKRLEQSTKLLAEAREGAVCWGT